MRHATHVHQCPRLNARGFCDYVHPGFFRRDVKESYKTLLTPLGLRRLVGIKSASKIWFFAQVPWEKDQGRTHYLGFTREMLAMDAGKGIGLVSEVPL